MTDVASETTRRVDLWNTISKEHLNDLEPARLRHLGIYGGAQGIWVDKAHTASPDIGPDGVTVAILHTGRHYADDLSDDGVIYHYPTTTRPAARDAAEVQATKNAMIHRIPIFVVLPGARSKSRRSLKVGYVTLMIEIAKSSSFLAMSIHHRIPKLRRSMNHSSSNKSQIVKYQP